MPEMDRLRRFESGIVVVGNGASSVVMMMLLELMVDVVVFTGQLIAVGVNVIAAGMSVKDETGTWDSRAGHEQQCNQGYQVRQSIAPRLHLKGASTTFSHARLHLACQEYAAGRPMDS